MSLLSALRGTVVAPRATLRALAEARALRLGLALVVLSAGVHALFSALLAVAGHQPSVALLPIPRARYYLAQAFFVIPVELAAWAAHGWVAAVLGRRLFGGRGDLSGCLAALGAAQAVPMLFAFLLPDLVVYLGFGFGALGPAMRWYAPVAAVWSLVLAVLAVAAAHRMGAGRALALGTLALLVRVAITGTFVR